MRPITVLIVDDSALIRHLFSDLLKDAEGIEVVGVADNAQDAREKIKRLHPQVLTLDIEMPGMDGLSFLEKIMQLRPMPVIMVSTLTQKGASSTLRALELGAVDYISKPTGADAAEALCGLRDELIEKIRTAASANLARRQARVDKRAQPLSFHSDSCDRLIAIGASTGGVEALRDIFTELPANTPPIVITQHMPRSFTRSFAARLNGLSAMHVHEARHGMRLEAGHAYLAPGGEHLRIVRKHGHYYCQLDLSDPVSGHRPSVDVLFSSVAEAAGAQAVGVILTGMGKDGASGLLEMRNQGAHTIGQNAASCIVYGMPRVAATLGAVAEELPLAKIAAAIVKSCESVEVSHARAV